MSRRSPDDWSPEQFPGTDGGLPTSTAGGRPTERGAEVRRDVGEDLDVVLVLEAERQGEDDLADLAEAGVRVEGLGDLLGGAEQILGEEQLAGALRDADAGRAGLDVGRVLGALLVGGGVGGDDDEALRDAGTLGRGCSERADVPGLDLGEVDRVLGLDDVAGQEVHAVSPSTLRGPRAATAVPEAVLQGGRVRFDPVGPFLDALAAAEGAGLLAADEPEQSLNALVAEVLALGGVGVEGRLDVVPVHRRADADAGVEAAAGEDVDGGEVLGQPERVLPAERDDGGAELDPAGALRRGGEDGDRRGDAVLEVPVPHEGAVEAELLPERDDVEGGLVTGAGIGGVEEADGEEAELLQRHSGCGHAATPQIGVRSMITEQ